MKYELLYTEISSEIPIENTDNYKIVIQIRLHPVDNIAPDFSKDIIVVSSNSQTGFEVDAQREQEIQNYLNQINQ